MSECQRFLFQIREYLKPFIIPVSPKFLDCRQDQVACGKAVFKNMFYRCKFPGGTEKTRTFEGNVLTS